MSKTVTPAVLEMMRGYIDRLSDKDRELLINRFAVPHYEQQAGQDGCFVVEVKGTETASHTLLMTVTGPTLEFFRPYIVELFKRMQNYAERYKPKPK